MWSREEAENIFEACYALKIKPSCNLQEVKRVFRAQSLLIHPDKDIDNPSAKTQFQIINNARDVLTDELIRQRLEKYPINDNLMNDYILKKQFENRPTFDNLYNFWRPSPSNNGKNAPQFNWGFDSNKRETLKFKDFSPESKDHVTFSNYMSPKPCISLTFKHDNAFYNEMCKKIKAVPLCPDWKYKSVAEGSLEFWWPHDIAAYMNIVKIIFEDYHLPNEYLNLIMNRKPKDALVPNQQKKL